MPTKILRIVKIASLFLICFLLGTVFGLHEGGFAFYVTDAVPKGVISMSNLKTLDKQNLAQARTFLNMDVDQGLYYYSIAQDQWWFSLYKIGLMGGSYSQNTEYVTRLAKYRKLNPSPAEDPAIFDQVPKGKEEYAKEYAELAVAHRDRLNRIKAVVDEYSAK